MAIIVLILIAIISVLVISIKVNHQVKFKREVKNFMPPGEIAELNGKKIHVFTKGQGEITLVFMAGHGTSGPVLDFKPLWAEFADDYKIVVVEKSGYGWSEKSASSRNIDVILEETRQALTLAGEAAPYVLVPHSMSGLEALYWAKKYPHEIKAIVGLDPLTPGAVELLPIPGNIKLRSMYFISQIGLSRLMPESELENNFPLLKSDYLTKEEKEQYIAMFYKNSFTKDILNETKSLDKNAKAVDEIGVPTDTPMLFFISQEQEKNLPGWEKYLIDYLKEVKYGDYSILDTGHNIHYQKSEKIAQEAKDFLRRVNKDNNG